MPIDRYTRLMPRSLHAGVVLLAASAAQGQVTAQDLPEIQQGGLDVNPLAMQQFVMPLDLQVPNGFETIYQVNDPQGNSQYVRFGGGTAAVFPRSVYIPLEEGVLPDIPPGTIFYIDGLPASYSSPEALGPAWSSASMVSYQVSRFVPQGVNMRPTNVVFDAPSASTEPVARPISSMWVSDVHRRKRVSQLLHAAADARR